MEIYNEELRDLLAGQGRESDIRVAKSGKLEVIMSGKEVQVAGLTSTEVQTPQEVGRHRHGLAARLASRLSKTLTIPSCYDRGKNAQVLFHANYLMISGASLKSGRQK